MEHRNSLEVCTNMQSLSILFLNKYTDMSDEPLKFYNYPSEGARYQSNTLGRSRVLFATCLEVAQSRWRLINERVSNKVQPE